MLPKKQLPSSSFLELCLFSYFVDCLLLDHVRLRLTVIIRRLVVYPPSGSQEV